MKRKFISLVVCIAFIAVLAVPAGIASELSDGETLTYNVSYESGTGVTNDCVVTRSYGSVENVHYNPEVSRNIWASKLDAFVPITLQSGDWAFDSDLEIYDDSGGKIRIQSGLIYPPWGPDILYHSSAIISPPAQRPPVVGTTWGIEKHFLDDFRNYPDPPPPIFSIVQRQCKMVGIEPIEALGQTLDCWHIVEYPQGGNPDGPYTYEHWYSPYVGANVKVIDRDTFQGEETWVLAGTNLLHLNSVTPNIAGNGRGNKKLFVTITGYGFQTNSRVKLRMSGQPDRRASKVSLSSPTELTCYFNLTPTDPGVWDVVVTNPGGETETLTDGFTVNPHPVITSIVTDPALVKLGDNPVDLTINGSNFQDGATVKLTKGAIGTIDATDVNVTSGQITCHFNMSDPPAHLGAWKILVTNPDGGIHWSPTFKVVVKP